MEIAIKQMATKETKGKKKMTINIIEEIRRRRRPRAPQALENLSILPHTSQAWMRMATASIALSAYRSSFFKGEMNTYKRSDQRVGTGFCLMDDKMRNVLQNTPGYRMTWY